MTVAAPQAPAFNPDRGMLIAPVQMLALPAMRMVAIDADPL